MAELVKRLNERLARLFWRFNSRVNQPYLSNARPIVIGGCPRSGTTLLRVILDSHPNICCGPESYLFTRDKIKLERLAERFDISARELARLLWRCRSRAQFVDLFFHEYCRINAKPRWGEKTPKNIRFLPLIFRNFPQARFIHLIRDGRDTVCSLRTHPRYKLVDGQLVEKGTRRGVENCARMWCREVSLGLQWRDDPRYREIRYEDLLLKTRSTLKDLLKWLEEPWDEAVLRHHEFTTSSRQLARMAQNPQANAPIHRRSIGRWQHELSGDEMAIVEEIAGPLLKQLGYMRPE